MSDCGHIYFWMSGLITTVLLMSNALLPSVFAVLGPARHNTCDHYVQLGSTNQTTNETVDFEYVGNSSTCKMDMNSNWQSYRQCDESEITMSLYTESILPFNRLPYIRLNMSTVVHEPATEIWFLYRCVHANDAEDKYCNDPSILLPCRGVRIDSSTNLTVQAVPFRADVLCFKVFGYSQYRIDIIVEPIHCTAAMFATMPHENVYDPTIAEYLNGTHDKGRLSVHGGLQADGHSDYSGWSPFVFVETHPNDGVWVRIEEPPSRSRILEVRFALFRQNNVDGTAQFIKEETVRLPRTGFKWTDLDAGSYLIYAYVQSAHCRLICNSNGEHKEDAENSRFAASTEHRCVVCPHTSLNFTIPVDKHTSEWKRQNTLTHLGLVSGIVLLVVFSIIGVALFAVVIYQRFVRPQLIRRRPPQNFELTAQPRVLLLYTDDCQQHSECCLQLAYFLAVNASARVHVDQLDLVDPSVRATNWLLNRLTSVDFILIVFSDGSKRVMEGERMIEQRPFPDLFNAALRLVVSKITTILNAIPTFAQDLSNRQHRNGTSTANSISSSTQNGHLPSTPRVSAAEALRKFVILRFNYSSPTAVAEFFPLVGCRCYEVPGELPRLVGHLHGVDADRSSVLDISAEHLQLNEAIELFVRFRNSNPNYLADRFATDGQAIGGVNPFTGNQLADPNLPERHGRTEEEMADLTQRYDLIQPADDEDENLPNGALNSIGQYDTGIVTGSINNRVLCEAAAVVDLPPPQLAERYPLMEVPSSSSESQVSDDES
ncbi:SEFIR domain-containing protein [Aphelenchoides besseyi]|nr:SEFIR domain-containing protein [Aphelenchoides besseyi]KAI6211114.1 SEFIR domain-containing protein [Aphelenchoides besseyi]